MKSWAVQDAKNQLSQLIDVARNQGPQTITRHGQPVVVVVTAEELKQQQARKKPPLEFFSRLKETGLGLQRRKDLPRPIPL